MHISVWGCPPVLLVCAALGRPVWLRAKRIQSVNNARNEPSQHPPPPWEHRRGRRDRATYRLAHLRSRQALSPPPHSAATRAGSPAQLPFMSGRLAGGDGSASAARRAARSAAAEREAGSSARAAKEESSSQCTATQPPSRGLSRPDGAGRPAPAPAPPPMPAPHPSHTANGRLACGGSGAHPPHRGAPPCPLSRLSRKAAPIRGPQQHDSASPSRVLWVACAARLTFAQGQAARAKHDIH